MKEEVALGSNDKRMKLNLQSNLNLSTKELLAHHDVVFRAPVHDPMYGLPLGDGSTGLLIWLEKDVLRVKINSTDFVDDTQVKQEPAMGDTSKGEEVRLRGGAVLELKFPCPIFESIYQEELEARLSLGDAVASVHAKTPFAGTDIRAFASGVRKVAVLTVEADFDEQAEIETKLERWGSSSFNRWYGWANWTASSGLGGTAASVEECCMCITQELHGPAFCIAVMPMSRELKEVKRVSSRVLKTGFDAADHFEQTYYISVAVEADPICAKAVALKQIREAVTVGTEVLYQEHASDWENFWNKSYISLPEKQDVLENHWYLNLYYANCQMRGRYPHLAWGGIWGNFYDYSPWGDTLHWNAQCAIFPLGAANHPELEETYLRYCRQALPNAEWFAKNIKQKNGAFYTDVCDLKGRMCAWGDNFDNCSPGAHIAMEMYQHYRYTGDETFLNETLLPVMRGAAEFYLDMLEMEEDGYYHIHGTSAYEDGFVRMDDCVTDMSAIRALFAAIIQLVPEEEAAPYREHLEKLAPFYTADFYEEEVDENGVFLMGEGKGRKIFADKILAAGIHPRLIGEWTEDNLPDYAMDVRNSIGKERLRITVGDVKRKTYMHPDQELYTVFPTGVVGIDDKGTDLYNWLANCLYLHPESCAGWCRMPIFLARMGMADLLEDKLDRHISAQMVYPQGPGLDFHRRSRFFPCKTWNEVFTDVPYQRWIQHHPGKNNGETTTIPAWDFRYFSFEPGPIIATAVNEMLLQSYNGTLRLFPAILKERQAAFRLAATGGRMVEAVFDNGECEVFVTCSCGGTLRITADHVNGPLYFTDADTKAMLTPMEENGIYTLETTAGQHILVKTEHADGLSIERDYSRNMDVKHLREAKLGTEKEF